MENNQKIHADAVIFDKDGTLLDFDAFWVTVSRAALHDVLDQLGQDEQLAEQMLEAIGVHNGVTDIDSVLCKGTYAQIAQIVHKILQEQGCQVSFDRVHALVVDAYNKDAVYGKVKATCPHLRDILESLKQHHKKLAVITTDNPQVTAFCLHKLGIEDLFDKVYTDDGVIPTKPCPDCAEDFCRYAHLNKEDVVMVGDTMTDVDFAHGAGLHVVGVAKTAHNTEVLSHDADAVIHDLSELADILD